MDRKFFIQTEEENGKYIAMITDKSGTVVYKSIPLSKAKSADIVARGRMVEFEEMKTENFLLFVYLAAPYTQSDSSANVRRVVEIATALRNSYPTVQVFVPHLYHFWNLMVPEPREFWLDQCFAWINKCDILCRLEGESVGADAETEIAQQRGKVVLYGARELFEFLDNQRTTQPTTNEQ